MRIAGTCLLFTVLMAPALMTPAILPAIRGLQQNEAAQFVNVASSAGISFKHENGASAEKYMPETMAGGALIFDYNNDGWPDLFFVNGGSLADKRVAAGARHKLYRNAGNWKFTDVTESSGISVSGFGMGACSADYDDDGWPDLYVTAVGPDKLYRNTGKGTFADVSDRAGVGSDLWSTSCAFGDIDNDGDADLYVVRYVDFAPNNNKYCTLLERVRSYCHPNVYSGVPDLLYRNNGDGTFTDITAAAGIRKIGNGLGVVFGDYDDDGWIDIYVANDSTPNFLYRNKGKGVFEEVGTWAGVAVGIDGRPLAGMGTDMGDMNGDGLLDIFVTNLDGQTHSLYKNLGRGLFADVTFPSGLGEATLPFVGFGTAFLDYDNDGDLDLAVANGDVIDNIKRLRDSTSYEQLNLLLQNEGAGKFTSVGPRSGSGFAIKKASRALAIGDLDNDGDLDLVVSNIGGVADVLRNDLNASGNRANSVLIRLIGSTSNRDAVGARLKLRVGSKTLVREVKAGSSYLAQNDLRIHFGLGGARSADRLEVRWPGGAVETIENIPANEIVTVQEGKGITARQVLAGTSTPIPQVASASPVTFSKDVAPIFLAHCVSCHRPGEIGPFSVLNYNVVRPWARSIRQAVLTHHMPPWFAEGDAGAFLNARTLNDAEVRTIVAWVDSGATEGRLQDLPKAPVFADTWQIGTPDLIVTMTEPYKIPATGLITNVLVPTDYVFPKDTWVQAVEVQPGNRRVVHQALAVLGNGGLANGLSLYSSGLEPLQLRDGYARFIPAGTRIFLRMHYNTVGSETTDRTRIGLKFATKPVHTEVRVGLAEQNAGPSEFVLNSHKTTATLPVAENVRIHAIRSHMPARGREAAAVLIMPDGSRRSLLSLRNWTDYWQYYYTLSRPMEAPRGAFVEYKTDYDRDLKSPADAHGLFYDWTEVNEANRNDLEPILIKAR